MQCFHTTVHPKTLTLWNTKGKRELVKVSRGENDASGKNLEQSHLTSGAQTGYRRQSVVFKGKSPLQLEVAFAFSPVRGG